MTTQAVTRTQKFQKYTGKLYVKGNVFKVIPSCIDGWDLCATYCLQLQPPCIGFNYDKQNKAYRPNAHLLYIVMHYNGNIL